MAFDGGPALLTPQITISFRTRLASDHAAALYPDTDAPFTDAIDVVHRLLPYHIFQQPKQDLEEMSRKGKVPEDSIKAEITGQYHSSSYAWKYL